MEPTLRDGCSILVDRSRREPHSGRIYVMQNEGGLIVRRVEQIPERGWWLLTSDNSNWPTEVMDEDTDIIGEVKWYSVTL